MTLELLNRHARPQQGRKGGERTFLNSVIAAVREQRTILQALNGEPVRLEAWFRNNFDEPHHHGFQQTLFQELAAYLHAGYEQARHIADQELNGDVRQAQEEFLDCLYMTLRFIQFIRGHDAP